MQTNAKLFFFFLTSISNIIKADRNLDIYFDDNYFNRFCSPQFAERSSTLSPDFDDSTLPDTFCSFGGAIVIENESLPSFPDANMTYTWTTGDDIDCEVEIINIE